MTERRKHSLRVPEDVWAPAIEKAHRMGLSISTVIEARLAHYADSGPLVSDREQGNTKQRNATVANAVWGRAQAVASMADESVAEVVRRELEIWLGETDTG